MPVNKKPSESPESASPILSDIDVQITTNGDVSRKPPSPPVHQIITDEGVDLHLGTTDVPELLLMLLMALLPRFLSMI